MGAHGNDDSAFAEGAMWFLSLNSDATVASWSKLSAIHGWLGCVLDLGDLFGVSVAALGDLDGDGRGDIAVGASHDGDVGTDQGAVWILFFRDLAAVSATYSGDGINLDTIAPVDALLGGSWSAPLTIGHPHGTGGLLTLMVRTCTNNGVNINSPAGGRRTEFLLAGPSLSVIRGFHDGITGNIPPQPVPNDTSLLGLTWAAQYVVLGGGFGDYSQAVYGITGR